MTRVLLENNQEEIEISEEIKDLIEKCVTKALEYEECNFEAEVSVLVVGEDEIRELNREHRGKDAVTDVLSFPILEFDEDANILDYDYDFDDELVLLGDIVICAKRAEEQAKEFGHSFIREIAFLTVHSMLHLLGYDHEHSDDEEQLMFKKQKEILNLMGITRD